MKPFRFNLDRVLEFQAAQLRAEEVKLQILNEEAATLRRTSESLDQSRASEEDKVRNATVLNGSDLQSLELYRRQIQIQKQRLRDRLADVAKRLEAQREQLLKVRRKHRLLEKLKERRLQEWTIESSKELEQIASESHLARFVREQER